jgi:ABC-type multidrug transport system fused ATPase/permease subunit
MTIPLRQYWDLLSRHIRPQKGRFILLTLLLFGSIGLQVVNPQIMRFFIDTALSGGALQKLVLAAVAFIGIALVQQAVSIGVTYLGENVAWTATNALRAELAWHCLNLDMGFHNEHTPGELIERIDGDVTELANFFSQMVVTMIGNGLLLVGILAALFYEDWRAGLAFSLFSAVSLYALNRVRDIALLDQKNRRQAEADLFGFVEEQLNATEDIRSSGAVGFSLRELFRLQASILRVSRKTELKSWLIHLLTGGMLMAGNLLAFVTGYLLYQGGAITIGTVYLFIYYINLLEGPIWTLTHQVQNFQTIGACIERLSELRKLQPLVKDPADGRTLPGAVPQPGATEAGPLELAFEGVSFSYNSEDTILQNLTFRLQPRRVLGLLGRTGSGKTTLTRLIFRLYDPTTGRILVDGADLRDGGLQALRRRIGVVTQEVQLFRASVRDNLTFFDPAIPDERILAVLEELELGEWYRSLPHGLETHIATGGHSLSAGEGQLLAFARIFLRNPGLVILDEASSRLDPATEQRVERAIDRLLKDRTAIVIAHRLGTVQRADEIMILEGGQVCEHGPRLDLAGDPGSHFYRLLQTGLEEVLA